MFDLYDDILTVDQVCEALHIGKNSAYQLLNSGRIKAFQMGRTCKIPRIAITDYILAKAKMEK